MTPATSLMLLGGGPAQAMRAKIATSPVISQRRRRPSMTMPSRMQEPLASRSAKLRRREETAARALDQGSADLAAKAMAHQALAHEWPAAIRGEKSRLRLELAEAKWSDGLLLWGINHPKARSFWQNEPMESPISGSNSDLLSASSLGPTAEVCKQRERNRSAIQLVNTWLHEDAVVEPDTWELLKLELDRDRLSGRRFWT